MSENVSSKNDNETIVSEDTQEKKLEKTQETKDSN